MGKSTSTTHTLVEFMEKSGDTIAVVTRMSPFEVSALVTGTTRADRFIALSTVYDTTHIINLDRIVEVVIEEHDEDDDEDD